MTVDHDEIATVIQHDWHLALREGKSFFIGRKQKSTPTAFLDVKVESDGTLDFDPKPAFEHRISLENHKLTVEASGLTSTFVPPCQEYDSFHKELYHSIDASPAGGLLLAADDKGALNVINVATGERMIKLTDHIMDIYKCRVFPSGLVAVTAGIDLTVRLWSLELKQCLRTFKGHKEAVVDVAVVGVGKEVVSCSKDGTVILWLCADGSILNQWALESGQCTAIAISNDSGSILVVCESKAFVINLTTKEVTPISTESTSSAGCFNSENSNEAYIGDENGTIHQCNLTTGSVITRRFTSRGKIFKLLHTSKGLIAAFNDGTVCRYQTMETNAVVEFTGADCDPIYDLSMSNNLLYTSCRDKTIRKYTM